MRGDPRGGSPSFYPPTGRGRGDAPLYGAGRAAPPQGQPPFSLLAKKRKRAAGRSKREERGRARRCGGDLEACAGCAVPLGNRESASPHLRVWERLSGVVVVWSLLLFPRSPLRLALTDSRSAERQRRVGESQIGFAARPRNSRSRAAD